MKWVWHILNLWVSATHDALSIKANSYQAEMARCIVARAFLNARIERKPERVWNFLSAFFAMLALCFCAGVCLAKTISVYYNSAVAQFSVQEGIYDKSAAARAIFEDSYDQTGWANLQIDVRGNYPNSVRMKAAGVAEGYLTKGMFLNHKKNLESALCENWIQCQSGEIPTEIEQFFSENYEWVKNYLKTAQSSDFVEACKLVMEQFEGIVYGCNMVSGEQVTSEKLWQYVKHKAMYDLARMKKMAQTRKIPMMKKGTGFVSLPSNFKDMYIAHASWRDYSESLKIAKRYRIVLEGNMSMYDRKSMSGVPFMIHSDDDWEITDNGMIHMSAGIAISDDVIAKVTPRPVGLPSWLRATAASLESNTANSWADSYRQEPLALSGVEHFVVDVKQLKYGEGVNPNFAVVVDEIPGRCASVDVSKEIHQTQYYGIYDIPRISAIYDAAGYAQLATANPLIFDKEKSARVKILANRHRVRSFENTKTLIRENDPDTITYQEGKYEAAMAPRSELEKTGASCDGAVDGKATSLTRILHAYWQGVNSPTYADLPVFTFSGSSCCKETVHEGIPDKMEFGWQDHYFDLDLE